MALSFSFLLWKKGGKPEVPVGLQTFRGSMHVYSDLVERLTGMWLSASQAGGRSRPVALYKAPSGFQLRLVQQTHLSPLLCPAPELGTADSKVGQTWPLPSICGARWTQTMTRDCDKPGDTMPEGLWECREDPNPA